MEREEDGPPNTLSASNGLFTLLTVRDPPFEEALDWLQLSYNEDQAGAYVEPASTFLAQSAIEEGGKLFPWILSHLRRLYTEVYGPAFSLGQAPERREFILKEETKVLSISNSILNSSSKLGACAGRLKNLALA